MPNLAERARVVAWHAASSVLPPLFGALVSLLVVRLRSPSAWGAVVDVIIIAQLAAHIIAWGNKEHLLRLFSTQQDGHSDAWSSSLQTRAVVLGPAVLAAMALYGRLTQGWSWPLIGSAVVWIAGQVVVQSLDVGVLFHKRFSRQIGVDLGGAAVTLAVLAALVEDVTAVGIVQVLAAVTVGKAVVLRGWMADVLPGGKARIDRGLLGASWPFFLMGVTGLLGSRVDLYCVAAQLPDAEVARYQVLINMLLQVQGLANLALLPFVREVYGMKTPRIRALALQFLGAGVVICGVAVAGIWALMIHAYQLPVSWMLLAFGFGYCVQMYLASPLIYGLYRVGRERAVLRLTAVSVLANLGGNLVLIPVLGLEGALLASFLAQVGFGVGCWFLVGSGD